MGQNVKDALTDKIASVVIVAVIRATKQGGIAPTARQDESWIGQRRQDEIELIAGEPHRVFHGCIRAGTTRRYAHDDSIQALSSSLVSSAHKRKSRLN